MIAEKCKLCFSFPADYFACLLTICLHSYDLPLHACLQTCKVYSSSCIVMEDSERKWQV